MVLAPGVAGVLQGVMRAPTGTLRIFSRSQWGWGHDMAWHRAKEDYGVDTLKITDDDAAFILGKGGKTKAGTDAPLSLAALAPDLHGGPRQILAANGWLIYPAGVLQILGFPASKGYR